MAANFSEAEMRALIAGQVASGLVSGLSLGPKEADTRIAEIAETAPYAVNVQVKTEIRRMGKSKEPADLARVIGILREARYSGYIVAAPPIAASGGMP